MRVTAVIIKQKKVLLMHRKRDNKEYWIFPGGSVEAGETVEKALGRGLKEETSFDINFFKEESYYLDKNKIKNPIYYCKVSDGEPVLDVNSPEAHEHSEKDWYHFEWIELDKALELDNLYPQEGKKIILKRI